ncbi:hypothetical protein [Leekyejoonella antrihumi]|uniref:hypothetical protein n=1 Tax=Leekyejoonella antrihumi TaxID=1660198 RepID=UPI00164682DC|nr:hypothetical protein [Leekyejoonella antrihumi]
MTPTTVVNIAWSGPYYRRTRWRDLPAAELRPELAATRRREAAVGLGACPRTAMIKQL